MKKLIIASLLIISNLAIAAGKPPKISDVNDLAKAKEHISASSAFTDAVKKEITAEIDKTKDKTKYVTLSRLNDAAKTAVQTYLTSSISEINIRITNQDQIATAVATRPDILATVTLLIAKKDTYNLNIIKQVSSRDQKDIAAVVKLIELSQNDGSLQKMAKDALEEIAKNPNAEILAVLKKLGYRQNQLEDLIIC